MNFFQQQEAARRRTGALLAYYALAVAAIVCAFYLASRGIAAVAFEPKGRAPSRFDLEEVERSVRTRPPAFRVLAWDPLWLLITVGLSLAVIGGGTLYRRATLAGGGAAVARAAGGREITPAARNLLERRLLNVVEEMALASGVPVPRVFVLDDEHSVNAFAAGFTPNDAAVAVTRGTLERLSRDELQGVVAHEFSHILNGDMRLNSWLIGVLFGILVTSVLGRELMGLLSRVRVSGRKKDGGNIALAVFLAGLALWLIGSIGVFFARLIQCSVSRQREVLADASAVQFTRNPSGLAGALKRIGAAQSASALLCPSRSELSHLLFAPGAGLESLFATHPPLVERIRLLEPGFDGNFAPWRRQPAPPAAEAPSSSEDEPPAGVLQSLAPALRESAAQPAQAAAMLYALVLSDDDDVRLRQRGRIAALEGQPLAAAAERLRLAVRQKDRTERRMLTELAVEGARQRDAEARATCALLVAELAESDREISLFEYMLKARVARRLSPAARPSDVRRRPLPPEQLRGEAAVVLGALAYAGQPEDDAQAEQAWREGAAHAPAFGLAELLPERGSCSLEAFDRALAALDGLSPLAKGELIAACLRVVRADAALTPDETELLRSVADLLDMPLPPLEPADAGAGRAA